MDLDYFKWCLARLSTMQYVLYQCCLLIGEAEIQLTYLAEVTGASLDTIRNNLKSLQQKGFIIYVSQRGEGATIRWVRHSATETPPRRRKEPELIATLISPDGRETPLIKGTVMQFCRANSLHHNELNRLINGKKPYHKGWRVQPQGGNGRPERVSSASNAR